MSRILTCIVLLLFLSACATDVVVSTGAAAEGKKQEIEKGKQQKKEAEDSLKESLAKEAERKKEMEQ